MWSEYKPGYVPGAIGYAEPRGGVSSFICPAMQGFSGLPPQWASNP